jgi:hypothetical protein
MKLKNRDLTEGEQRLGATDSQLLQDRIVRTGLLAIVAFGVAALAWMAVYLICLSPPFQESDPAVNAMRTWRTVR